MFEAYLNLKSSYANELAQLNINVLIIYINKIKYKGYLKSKYKRLIYYNTFSKKDITKPQN